jgi:hypothetical protein
MSPDNDPETRWPAVALAYEFVIPSYQLLAGRFEAADTRISAGLTIASTVTLGTPLFAKAVRPDVSFESPPFVLAIVAFVFVASIGLIGRVRGCLTLPDPMSHYCENLHQSHWEFKRDAVYFAGKHFQMNAEAIRKKSNVSLWMTAFMVI